MHTQQGKQEPTPGLQQLREMKANAFYTVLWKSYSEWNKKQSLGVLLSTYG